MVKVTATQVDRLNMNLLFNEKPIGSEVETSRGPGIVNGIRTFKGELVFAVTVQKEGGGTTTIALPPARLGIEVFSDPDDIAELSKATGKVIAVLNEALPKPVETKVAASPHFEFTGPKLRAMRIAAGLTQTFVAQYLGMAKSSSAAIGDWEAERTKVPVKHQAKLIDLYTPEPEEVLEHEDYEDEDAEPTEEDMKVIEEYNARREAEAAEAAEATSDEANDSNEEEAE